MRRISMVLSLVVMVPLLLEAGGAGVSAQETEPVPNAVSSVQGALHIEGGALPGAGDSHAPLGSRESVINADDRKRVRRTAVYPNSAIGRLTFDTPAGGRSCTAFLIDADTVLTSGHCVHAGGTGSASDWFTGHVFAPGQNGAVLPFGTCGVTELWTLPGWFDDQRERDDLGLAQLDCEVGDDTGWLGYFSRPGPRALNQSSSHLRGYPGDKPTGTMWTDKKRIRVTQVEMVFYRMDTYGGQSGSPVYRWGKQCSGPCVMAVHGYGVHGAPPHKGNNHGVRITTDREALIASLAGQNGG